MPMIDISVKPGFQLRDLDGSPLPHGTSRPFIYRVIGPELPGLFVRYGKMFGMDPDTPQDAVQVMFHDFGEYDINVPDIWMKVQFSEVQSEEISRHIIRNAVFEIIADLFRDRGAKMPANFILDMVWGPTHGRGYLNGTSIEW